MFVVGLTGGIASGKSTVCALFADLGVAIVDADVIARQLVEPGKPALDEIVANFGEHILDPETGALCRRAMSQQVFTDPQAKKRLEAILHPQIRQATQQQITQLAQTRRFAYCINCVPLLIETQQQSLFQRILVVDCFTQQQLQRSIRRDHYGPAQANAILAAQANREERLQHADDVIQNDGDADQLPPQVAQLHKKYQQLTRASTGPHFSKRSS